ncbi:MAG: aldehyde dehydrogenase [Euryarchaeota archaeon]|jgi:aminomuconate-semialdehyde/2-hydroxymuconate-6-semialdehyde dehydrogenase|nr:aldehyde dehydrogenase [Euryarchaeota archaeon]MBT3971079.1 aldehyde dehydrogenase [Euryarchaeota archaeon]MBT6644958.1 aldehyde dehydrogenase [Euryarchaeota archaeon]
MQQVLNLMNGVLIPAGCGETIDNISPATGQKIATIPRSNDSDVAVAVKVAKIAQPAWATLSIDERAEWLDKIADALESKIDEIAAAESEDTGKPISLARDVDAARSVSNFRFFANLLREKPKEIYEMKDATNIVVDKPIGIVGLITPWNLPLYLLSWKIAPAIAMGNCVIAKPSELTPMTAFLLSQILLEVGLPVGVVNILHGFGPEVGQAILEHPEIGAISFTGGTATGRHVAATSAPMFKKLSLEMGGKNSTIILADADVEKAVAGSVRAAFLNQGQVCLCGSRILIADEIYDEFANKFVAKVESFKIGDPMDEDTSFGSLISNAHRQKVEAYIDLAIKEGGTILTGGTRPNLQPPFDQGAFLGPTVISDLSPHSRCSTEEIFGPVVVLHRFTSEEEAIAIANNTEYGLAGSVWTEDIDNGIKVAEAIDSGMIWINTWLHRDLRVPFGGVKNSGVGREGGYRSFSFYSEAMNINYPK